MITATALLAASAAIAIAQRPGVFSGSLADPAIQYATGPTNTAVNLLNKKLADGDVTLKYDEATGYLRSTLDALNIPVESQVVVYTKTSLQAQWITPGNPRAIYFNDTTAVAFVRGAPLLEVWAQDPRQGTIFYSLEQKSLERAPAFARETRCLACHLAWETLSVPGPLVLTTFPREFDYQGADGFAIDHRDELSQRWGGWYVTGRRGPARHMGNLPLFMKGDPPATAAPLRPSLAGTVDLPGYPTPYSDIVALMVLEHQTHALNLITRTAWEARIGSVNVPDAVRDLADYLLFVGEARIAGPMEGSSGFAGKFAAMGPRDSKGRSLRELQLEGRLMKYPLSYTIYSPAFDAIPQFARDAVMARLNDVLSGEDASPKYAHLTPEIRRAIVEILKETKGADFAAF